MNVIRVLSKLFCFVFNPSSLDDTLDYVVDQLTECYLYETIN